MWKKATLIEAIICFLIIFLALFNILIPSLIILKFLLLLVVIIGLILFINFRHKKRTENKDINEIVNTASHKHKSSKLEEEDLESYRQQLLKEKRKEKSSCL